MKPNEYNISIPKEKFAFANTEGKIHDKELATKPVSYLVDALRRFRKNKASIVAFIIICCLLVFAIFGPLFTPYTVAYNDANYKYVLPKIQLFYDWDIPFWDGCKEVQNNQTDFTIHYLMGQETGQEVIKDNKYVIVEVTTPAGRVTNMYEYRYDTYNAVGVIFKSVTAEEYQAIQQYQDETGLQVIYPITDRSQRPQSAQDATNANFWFKTITSGGKTQVALNANGEAENIYVPYNGNDGYTSKVRIEGEGVYNYNYAIVDQTGYSIRINYAEYYNYYHSRVLQDGVTYASHVFGANNAGQDIYACLGYGARFSFILAIVVASVNLIVGALYGAVEGYYGGKLDLMMERFVEILSAVPFMIVISLLKYHMEGNSQILILFIAFFLTGWIGMAGRTRMQFYRFKNQEYVLAARTLGAKDGRIMFKHIFPNALGTLVTSCVLVIPSVIFSETSLSYLGIINLSTGNLTSIGTMLSDGQATLSTYPHIILFPSLFICFLMLSFNLFGNGLRDAFNPSLRGAED